MLRSDKNQKIPSDNSSRCTSTPAQRPSTITSFFNANAPTFSNYLPPFRSQTDPLPEPPQLWNRTENMATTNTANTVAERAYGVLRSRAKVAKGIQTDEGAVSNRKRCWRHRRGSSDKSRRNSGSENEQSRQEANSNVPSPNGTAMSVLRSALLPNVSFPRWTRTNKAPRDNAPSEEGNVFSSLVESYLVPLYASSVRRQLTWQAEARCRDSNREHFEAHCLGPTARMLRTVREYVSA
ncbi:hypothetical protein JTE90_006898 [Oedothorax gibbosus]|uniref:Uncharacterized protein n=1 Tax=Oedothorax gibbosus TaxID=931172 RepID=A0AAV6VRL4_9ARAC|nr:hypothetical protein JTE90_006898 [Oedothorax gibbosus]